MITTEEIKRRVKNQLRWDDRVFSEHVEVDVADSTVTLSGEVPTYTSLKAAEDDALFTPGVKAVQNNLKVKYPEGVSVPTDSEIEERIQQIYKWNTHLNPYDLSVKVKNGWVSIGGTVESFWKKMVAEELAYSVGGVIAVSNEITIVPTKDISDQKIAEAVKDTIQYRSGIDVDTIDIKVEDGVVTLSGSTRTRSSASAAYETALYTAGVKGVVDEMVIMPE